MTDDGAAVRTSVKRVLTDGEFTAVYAHRAVPGTDHGVATVDIYRVVEHAVAGHWGVTRPVRVTAGRGQFEDIGRRTATDQATRAANRDLVRRMHRLLFVEHRVDEAIDACFDPACYRQHAPGADDGTDFIREGFGARFRAHPLATSELLHLIADDDLVLMHSRSRLGRDHPLRAVCDIFRVENGQINEHWDVNQNL